MAYLGDGISTDDTGSDEEAGGEEGISYTPAPVEEEAKESDEPPQNPDEG
ncbi:MAG: hypothetical protein Q8P88_01455 [Candidatus Jorgensenbacteria bacterium]|nr:hypothetical protein [Candidatus Jorgensenbacteria bacterium]